MEFMREVIEKPPKKRMMKLKTNKQNLNYKNNRGIYVVVCVKIYENRERERERKTAYDNDCKLEKFCGLRKLYEATSSCKWNILVNEASSIGFLFDLMISIYNYCNCHTKKECWNTYVILVMAFENRAISLSLSLCLCAVLSSI